MVNRKMSRRGLSGIVGGVALMSVFCMAGLSPAMASADGNTNIISNAYLPQRCLANVPIGRVRGVPHGRVFTETCGTHPSREAWTFNTSTFQLANHNLCLDTNSSHRVFTEACKPNDLHKDWSLNQATDGPNGPGSWYDSSTRWCLAATLRTVTTQRCPYTPSVGVLGTNPDLHQDWYGLAQTVVTPA